MVDEVSVPKRGPPALAGAASIGDRADPSRGDAVGSYIVNAGLVIATTYIPQLFTHLGLTRDDRFVDAAAVGRAVRLLQYVVDGRTDTSEPQLVLNKLLCGVDLAAPLSPEIDVTPYETAEIDSLLRAIVTHWRIIGKISVAGLRKSFLQRDGLLTVEEGGWRLRIVPRSYDMLLDRLPWSFATIQLPWMTGVVHVDRDAVVTGGRVGCREDGVQTAHDVAPLT